MKFLTM